MFKQYHLKNMAGATYYDGKLFHVYINRTFLKKNTDTDEDFMANIIDNIAHEFVHVKQHYFEEIYLVYHTFIIDFHINNWTRKK